MANWSLVGEMVSNGMQKAVVSNGIQRAVGSERKQKDSMQAESSLFSSSNQSDILNGTHDINYNLNKENTPWSYPNKEIDVGSTLISTSSSNLLGTRSQECLQQASARMRSLCVLCLQNISTGQTRLLQCGHLACATTCADLPNHDGSPARCSICSPSRVIPNQAINFNPELRITKAVCDSVLRRASNGISANDINNFKNMLHAARRPENLNNYPLTPLTSPEDSPSHIANPSLSARKSPPAQIFFNSGILINPMEPPDIKFNFSTQPPKIPTICKNCIDNGFITGRCVECEEFLCQKCVDAHARVKSVRNHQLIHVNNPRKPAEIIDQSRNYPMDLPNWNISALDAPRLEPLCMETPRYDSAVGYLFCTIHKSSPLRGYCTNCQISLCNGCGDSHNGHKMISLEGAVEQIRRSLLDLLQAAAIDMNKLKETILQIKANEKNLNKNYHSTVKDIKMSANSWVTQIRNRENRLLKDVEDLRDRKFKGMENQRIHLEGIMRDFSFTVEDSHRKMACSNGDSRDMVPIQWLLTNHMKFINEIRPTFVPHETAHLEFLPPVRDLKKDIESAGSLDTHGCGSHSFAEGVATSVAIQWNLMTYKLIIRNHHHFLRLTGGERVEGTIMSPSGNKIALEVADMFDGTYRVQYKPQELGKHRMHLRLRGLDVIGSPFLVDVNPQRVYKNLEGPIKHIYGFTSIKNGFHIQKPWGVHVDREGYAYITDRCVDRIVVLKPGSYEASHAFGQSGDKPGELCKPAGICTDSRRRVIVADKDNHRVQIFTFHGEYVSSFGRRGHDRYEFCYPWDVACDYRGHILVSDTRNHRVSMWSEQGQFLDSWILPSPICNYNKPPIDMPRGVCFDARGRVLVTDFNNHCVLVGDPNEPNMRLSRFGRFGRLACQFNRPQGITSDSRGNIYIADSRNERIQVFDTYLSFQYSIFNRGTNACSGFIRPADISIAPDGRMLVSDFEEFKDAKVFVF